jgi:hypothetical protein
VNCDAEDGRARSLVDAMEKGLAVENMDDRLVLAAAMSQVSGQMTSAIRQLAAGRILPVLDLVSAAAEEARRILAQVERMKNEGASNPKIRKLVLVAGAFALTSHHWMHKAGSLAGMVHILGLTIKII